MNGAPLQKLNLLFATIWLAIFGLSTVPTNESVAMVDMHDELIYQINCVFADMTPLSPAVHTRDGYEALALDSSEATQYFIRHTFTTLLFFLAALNVAFYAGKGTFGSWGGAIAIRWRVATRPIRERLALRRRQKQGISLRSDPDDGSEFLEPFQPSL